MTRSEAHGYLRDKADQALNTDHVPDPVRCWAEEVHDMLFVFNEAPADDIIAAIYEYGYVRGMEKVLHVAHLKPFNSLKSLADSAEAWKVLLDEFVNKCEGEKYGIE